MHLPGTFDAWDALANNPNVRMTLLGAHGLPWPWESLHVEALAWFDHWLKGRDTGIIDGPPIRYVVPGSDGWRTAEQWPPRAELVELALDGDGGLDTEQASASAGGDRRGDHGFPQVRQRNRPLDLDERPADRGPRHRRFRRARAEGDHHRHRHRLDRAARGRRP